MGLIRALQDLPHKDMPIPSAQTVGFTALGAAFLYAAIGTANMIGHDRDVRREAADTVLSMMDTSTFNQTFTVSVNDVEYRAQVTPGLVRPGGDSTNPFLALGNPAFDCWSVRLRVSDGIENEPTMSGIWGSDVTKTVYRDAGRSAGACHANFLGHDVHSHADVNYDDSVAIEAPADLPELDF